jgi:carbon-monoxide dehydrogenase iron sulfur subunit
VTQSALDLAAMLIARYIPKNCMACKSCELACALKHSTSRDINGSISEYPRPLSRLKIGVKDGKLHLTRCLHCKRPKCIEVCEASAITKSDDGVVTIDDERCTGCFDCVEACPFGAIQMRDHEAVKCDLCGGAAELSCVLACKCGALIYGQET